MLTGYSINLIKDFSIIKNSDFVITTNLGPLHDFISSRTNAYLLSTSGNLRYRKLSELCLGIALCKCDIKCDFIIKKSMKYYTKNYKNNKFKFIDDYFPLVGRLLKNKSNTVYMIMNQLRNFEEVYLWGADYALNTPIHSHFL